MFKSPRFKNLNPFNQVVGSTGLRHTFSKANERERQRKLYVKSYKFCNIYGTKDTTNKQKIQQNYEKTADNEE